MQLAISFNIREHKHNIYLPWIIVPDSFRISKCFKDGIRLCIYRQEASSKVIYIKENQRFFFAGGGGGGGR